MPGVDVENRLGRLSVIVVNFNYEKYVGTAIESALGIEHDDLEVVVVDDGSTDGSRAVIDRYRGRVRTHLAANSGQRAAANTGFALSTGDVVVFLDSDDVLPSDLAVRLAEVWRPGVSKAQFRMQRIDSDGVPTGSPFPAYARVPSSDDIRRWMTATSAYPTPPGSGNAYAREFLEQILPVGPEIGSSMDSACLAAAPLLGDVVCVPEVTVGYRRHGENDSNLLADGDRFRREVERARARWRFVRGLPADDRPLYRSRELLQLRVSAHRVSRGGSPLPGDTRRRLLRDALRTPFYSGPETVFRRLMIAGWAVAALCVPDLAVFRLLELRYGVS
ncbi:glycosyltransferase family 2 protein [Pseudonocardia alni]|uniref:glycosyltransferase family 2 protein n=1 Tax=Pseudonocardia alni TaxID=33907 RepID=UPI0038650A8C